jgi:hypothetical protein
MTKAEADVLGIETCASMTGDVREPLGDRVDSGVVVLGNAVTRHEGVGGC